MPATKHIKAKDKPRTNNFWYNRHNRLGLLLVVFIFAVAGYFLLFSKAAPTPPTIYLQPSSQVMAINTTFTVQVRENSSTTSVNAVQANFSYPASLVSFVSISTTGTAFPNGASISSGGSGQVSLTGGVSTTTGTAVPVTGDQLIATVTFKSLTTGGNAAMAFTSGTALVSSSTNQDILGSLTATGGGTYSIDTAPPTVSVSSPANGATVAGGGTITVSATATDTLSTISSVDIYIDSVKVATDTVTPYTYSWNTAGVALGSHTIQAKATDSAGNLGTSTTNTITLADQTAPTTPGALHTTATAVNSITFAWTASTDNIAVTGYKIMRGATVLTTTTSLTYTDSGLAAGTAYTYTVTALDAAGNASTAATLNASTAALVPGDANKDGHVDGADLSILLANWLTNTPSCDFIVDGVVNIFDLSTLLSHFGT